ncbi:MAG TPA: O-antigen ligase family protein, partial [Clostridia bacterium]
YKWFFALVLYGILIFFLINSYSKGLLLKEFKKINPFYNANENKLYFEDVSLSGDSASIRTNKWTLNIKCGSSGFGFSDEYGHDVQVQKDNEMQKLYFLTVPYSGITGSLRENEKFQWLMLDMEGKDIEFVKYEGKLQVVGYNGLVTDIEYPETFGFKGSESFASGRGYIWSRALPLLKKAVLLGYGPDTFTYIFPQNDIAGKLNYGAIWVIIGKPHSWYLQIALGSGILSLAFLMCFIVWFIVNALKFLLKSDIIQKDIDEERRERMIMCAILSAVIGYLVTGIFNDSVVAVSPIFWMMLGFGARMLKIGTNVQINKTEA